MNHVERFRAVMDFQPVDRLPRWEWAMWWDETIANWKQQGLPSELESVFDIAGHFGLETELIASGGGVFEVLADGELIFSKKQLNRFPEDAEIIARIEEML